MDSFDVSNVDEYKQMSIQEKKMLKAVYKERRGERPGDRRSRRELAAAFHLTIKYRELMSIASTHLIEEVVHNTFLAPPYLPSAMPLEELKQIFIDDLRIEIHHRGKYLLLRSITPPERMVTAIMIIVEDEREDGMVLQLYHQDDKQDQPATSIIKQDDVFIVKEPYFRVMADGNYGIRVDHVSDFVRIDPCDKRVPIQWAPRVIDLDNTANDWKLKGNDALKLEQYRLAVQRYWCTPFLNCLSMVANSRCAVIPRPWDAQPPSKKRRQCNLIAH